MRTPATVLRLARLAIKPGAAAVSLALLALQGAVPAKAYAGPAGGQVTAGSATISQSAGTTTVNQSTARAALDWQSFSINANESVIFRQPSAASVALNRVVGPDPSLIYGTLQANGQVFLINPSGVLFGRGANVDVAGLVASTLNIANNDFMAGRYVFGGGTGAGRIVNEADIRVKDGGYVAFLGNQVSSTGTLVANKGSVALGAGDSMVLDFNGDGLLSLKVNAAAAGAKIDHKGLIVADGGAVMMSAQAKNALLDTVLNVDGVVQARGAVMHEGHIYLEGGRSGVTRVAGLLDASSAQGKGGEVRVLGEYVGLYGDAKLDASGALGGGTVLVGGDFQGRNANVQNAFATYVGPRVSITADALSAGDGGKVIVWADGATRYFGSISARGGAQSGDGGFVEVSGKHTLAFAGRVDTSAAHGHVGTLLLDPDIINVVSSGADTTDLTQVDDFADPNLGAGGTSIDVTSINNAPATVTLQANVDININAPVAMTTNGAGLTAQAGNNINVNNSISTTNGPITLSARDLNAPAQFDGGTVNINAPLSSTGGAISITNNFSSTPIQLGANVNAGAGTVTFQEPVMLAGGDRTVTGNGGVSFAGTVDGAFGLSVNSTGATVTFSDLVGILTPLTALTVNATSLTLQPATIAGPVTLSVDNANLGGITTFGQIVTLQPVTAGRAIDVLESSSGGTLKTGGSLELYDYELAGINGSTLVLGRNDGAAAGAITLGADIAPQVSALHFKTGSGITGTAGGVVLPFGGLAIEAGGAVNLTASNNNVGSLAANIGGNNLTLLNQGALNVAAVDGVTGLTASTVFLQAAGTIGQAAGANITATNLGVRATAGDVTLDNAGNAVTNLAIASAGNATYRNAGGFTIASVADPAGVLTTVDGVAGAAVTLTALGAGSTITLNDAVAAGPDLTGTGPVTLSADDMQLNGQISAPGQVVTLQPTSNGRGVSLGAAGVNDLSLTSAELDNVTADTLRIGAMGGGGATGAMVLRADIAPANISNLHLTSGTLINGTFGGIILPAGGLALDVLGTAFMVNANNNVGSLAANTRSFALTFRDADTFAISTVDGVAGIGATTAFLQAGGPVTQAAGANILATSLGVRTTVGGVTLNNAANHVTNLAIASAANAAYQDASGFTVSTVSDGSNNLAPIAGVSAGAGSNVALTASAGTLTLANAVSAPGGTVTLNVPAGPIVQNAGGDITAQTLTGTAGTSAILNANNAITNLGAFTTSGNFTLNDTGGGLTLTGAVNAGAGAVSITTAGGVLALQSNNVTGIGGVTLTGAGVSSAAGSAVTTTAPVNSGTPSGAIQIAATGNGAVDLAGTLQSRGANTSTGTASAGGNVTLTTNNGAISVATVDARGGDGTAGTANGGNAGTIAYNVGGGNVLTWSGDQLAAGGAGADVGLGVGAAGSGRSLNIAAPVRLGADIIVNTSQGSIGGVGTSGAVTFGSTLESPTAPHSLSVITAAPTTFGGAVGGNGNPLSSLTTSVAGGTVINGGEVTTTGAQTYNDPVTLSADATLSSTGAGDIAFIGVQSPGTPRGLAVNTAGITTFRSGAVGGGSGNALRSLTTDAPGTTVLNTFEITTTETQTYNDPVTLGTGATLTSSGMGAAGNITFVNTLRSPTPQALTVNTAGTTTFGGAVGDNGNPLSLLLTDAAGSTAINGGSVSTTIGQFYGDAVILGADASLASNPGSITFSSTINAGAGNKLVVTAPTGGTTFSGNIGNLQQLADLDATGPVTFSGTGAQTVNVGEQGGNTVTFDGPITLGRNVTINTIGTGGANSVRFNGNIDADAAANNRTLTIGTNTGSTIFSANVGASQSLARVDVTSRAILWNGSAPQTVRTRGNGVPGSTAGLIITGPSTLTQNVTFDSGPANMIFASAIDGPAGLTITSNGDVRFEAAVGRTTPLASVTTNGTATLNVAGGSIRTSGAQTYNSPLRLEGFTTLSSTGAGDIAFNNRLDGRTISNAGMEVDTAGTTIFGAGYTPGLDLSTLTTDAPGTTAINAPLLRATRMTFNDPVTVGADTTVRAALNVVFESTVESPGTPHSLTMDVRGQTTFNRLVGGNNNPLRSYTELTTTLTNMNGGGVITTSAQTYGNLLQLGADTAFTSTGGGAIRFGRFLDGAFDTAVNTSGATTFSVDVGSNTPLRSLVTDAGGTTTIGRAISTSGAQTYNDAVMLPELTLFESRGGGNITFAGTVQSTTVDGALTATTSGATIFQGVVGGNGNPLRTIETDVPGTTAFNGGGVTTTREQTYRDPVTLGANAIFTSNEGRAIAFGSTIDGGSNLTVTSAGLKTFTGAVGATTPLASLAVNGNGTAAINGGAVTTTGAQTYSDAVTLGAANTTFASTGNAAITFGGSLDGASNVSVNTTGATVFGPAVGAGVALASLTTNAGGTTTLNGNVTTTNDQTYNDAVTLGANATLSTSALAGVTFGSTVDGGSSLTVNSAGITSFGGAVGATTALASLSTNPGGTTGIGGGAIATTGSQFFGDPVTFGASTTLNAGTGDIMFANTVNGGVGLTVNSTGTTTFSGTVGNMQPLASLTTNPGGSTVIGAAAVNTSGNQVFGDALVLGANTTFTSSAGNLTFGSTVQSSTADGALTANTSGATIFQGVVGGGGNPLRSLVTDAPGTTAFNGGGVTTTQGQTYNDPVTLGAHAVFASNGGGAIAFGNTIDGAVNFATRTSGATTFSGAIGGSAAPDTIEVTADTVRLLARTQARQIFVTANSVETPGSGLLVATQPFTTLDEANTALRLVGNTSAGSFGTVAAPVMIDATGLFVVRPNESTSLPAVYLGGDPAKVPVYQFANDSNRRFVFYNGARLNPPRAQTGDSQNAATTPLRDALDELREFLADEALDEDRAKRAMMAAVQPADAPMTAPPSPTAQPASCTATAPNSLSCQ